MFLCEVNCGDVDVGEVCVGVGGCVGCVWVVVLRVI